MQPGRALSSGWHQVYAKLQGRRVESSTDDHGCWQDNCGLSGNDGFFQLFF